MIFTTASNPVCMAAHSEKVAEAFGKAEFVVYSGHFMDDTADHAHVFLPATTFLEEEDLVASYGHNYLGPVNPAIAPVGECRSEFRMFQDLALRFPFADRFRRSVDDWLRDICAPLAAMGGDLETLKRGPFRLNAPMVPYENQIFPTKSGKFQFMTEFEPSRVAPPDPAYPYHLLTIAPHGYICSERTMAEHGPLPVIRFQAGEAARKGLRNGAPVLVTSAVGRLKAHLETVEEMRPDVVITERGGWRKAGHGLNVLTRDLTSKVGRGTPFYETSVAVSAWPEDGITGSKILVIQHSENAPGGNFTKELQRLGADLTVLHPLEGDALPDTPDAFDGLVVLGGPQHPFKDAEVAHFAPLMGLMRAFEEAAKPVAGICLGAQLLARAHGAGPWGRDDLEFGFIRHELTLEGKADPVIGEAGPLPRLMEFHETSFSLPDRATLLIKGSQYPHQCFRVGRFSYGLQFHLEADALIVGSWIDLFQSGGIETYRRYRDRYTNEFFQSLREELPLLAAKSEDFCRRVAKNWLSLLGPGVKASPEASPVKDQP